MKLTDGEQTPVSLGPPPSPGSGPSAGIRLGLLGWVFLRIGASAFGGLGAGLALIERDLVEKRSLLTRDDVTEALTCKPSPNPFSWVNCPIDRTIGFGYKRCSHARHACRPTSGHRAD